MHPAVTPPIWAPLRPVWAGTGTLEEVAEDVLGELVREVVKVEDVIDIDEVLDIDEVVLVPLFISANLTQQLISFGPGHGHG